MGIRIAVDTMGGDLGPRVIVSGALQFLQMEEFADSEIVFVGPEDALREILSDLGNPNGRVTVSHAPDVITMDDPPTDGVRRKESSVVVAHRLMKEDKVDAMVSTGNTGAVMASAIFNLGRIEGVSRPAIASLFPTTDAKPCLVLDVGANSDCKPDNLLEFAHMGSVYFEHVRGVSEPRVALLSIGEEKSKGNEVTISAHRRLVASNLNFIGNVEGRDVLAARSDVIVCDGFVGNVLLKFAESIQGFLYTKIKRQVSTNIFSRLGAGLMAPFLKRMKKTFDYAQYGGAPLLGTNGVTIICHGSSNDMAVMNGIKMARDMVINRVNDHINEQLTTRYASTKIKGPGK
jgi:glycerol-3-phosphate acyltransferase PlsX